MLKHFNEGVWVYGSEYSEANSSTVATVGREALVATREEAAHVWERCRRPKLDPAVMYDEA